MPRHAALFLLLTVACAGAADAPRAAVRDSAGITIVESPPPDSSTSVFTLSDAPLVVLGDDESVPAEQFARLSGAVRLPSGEFVVAESRATELRLFDADGAFLRLLARRGEGPGEFVALGAVLVGEDRLGAWDLSAHGITTFGHDGSLIGERAYERLPADSAEGVIARPSLVPQRLLRDGRLIAISVRPRLNPPSGTYYDTATVWLADTNGSVRTIGHGYLRAHYTLDTPDGSTTFGTAPFGPTGAFAFTDSVWYHSEGRRHEVREVAEGDVVRRIFRVRHDPAPVTDADRNWLIDSVLADYEPEYHAHERGALEFAEWSPTMPAYTALIRDSEGLLWARRYPYREPRAVWEIFDADGRLAATATTPAAAKVVQIGRDWLLVQARGEYDEPLVQLFSLRRDG